MADTTPAPGEPIPFPPRPGIRPPLQPVPTPAPAPQSDPGDEDTPKTAADILDAISHLYNTHYRLSLDILAQRIDWLASGVAIWPDEVITREHMLVQLRALANGARALRGAPHPEQPAPTGGAAA